MFFLSKCSQNCSITCPRVEPVIRAMPVELIMCQELSWTLYNVLNNLFLVKSYKVGMEPHFWMRNEDMERLCKWPKVTGSLVRGRSWESEPDSWTPEAVSSVLSGSSLSEGQITPWKPIALFRFVQARIRHSLWRLHALGGKNASESMNWTSYPCFPLLGCPTHPVSGRVVKLRAATPPCRSLGAPVGVLGTPPPCGREAAGEDGRRVTCPEGSFNFPVSLLTS